MRIALFSPMPPARSGIADYSLALAGELARFAELEIFSGAPAAFDASRFDVALYQLGNNPFHGFVYEAALAHAGVVVLHEANLHHLVAHLTISRGDWDAYERECEYNGGSAALEHARRARTLVTGPDYAGLPMLRRVLESARGVIVHSFHMLDEVRGAGFAGPLVRIPHGAWLPGPDSLHGGRLAWRDRLGIAGHDPLIGIFGFLKPYKRIAESLRAFSRLVRLEPRAKMILVGEQHPDLPLAPLIKSLGLLQHVRLLGFVPVEDFTGYMAACDIVLNLRYPTVGESSGSLQRALGLGRPALVSDIAAFRDYPDGVCLKVPAGAGEEDTIFEYLNLLVSRPDIASAIGARARAYAERECSWPLVARRYAEFLESVVCGGAPARPGGSGPVYVQAPGESGPASADSPSISPHDLHTWTPPGHPARPYVDTHLARLVHTLEITPKGGPGDSVLEMGAYLQITPALKTRLNYGEVRACYYGRAGTAETRSVKSLEGQVFECLVDLFDAERDLFPYPDGHFSTVLCCELIEHLAADPMHMMSEINRILRPGGHLVLTTPNIASLRALSAVLQGFHPGFFPAYIRQGRSGRTDPRHTREYAPGEIARLLQDSGFEVALLETGPFREGLHPELAWVRRLLDTHRLSTDLRGDDIYAVGRKTAPVRCRWPEWLYAG